MRRASELGRQRSWRHSRWRTPGAMPALVPAVEMELPFVPSVAQASLVKLKRCHSMDSLYTISSSDGLCRSQHPEIPEGSIAYLFHHESLAREHIAHLDTPSQWRIDQVPDLEAWLETILQKGFTHVYGSATEGPSTLYEIRFWLTSLRAWRVGRQRLA